MTITMKVQDWEHILNVLYLFPTPTIYPLATRVAASIMKAYERELKK